MYEEFIQDMIIKARFEDMDEEGMEMLMADIEPILEEYLMVRITSRMSDEELDIFENLLQRNPINEDELQDFLETIIPGYDAWIGELLQEFENQYLAEVQGIDQEEAPIKNMFDDDQESQKMAA